METLVRKHISRILKYMVLQQLGGGGVKLLLLLLLFFSFAFTCLFFKHVGLSFIWQGFIQIQVDLFNTSHRPLRKIKEIASFSLKCARPLLEF